MNTIRTALFLAYACCISIPASAEIQVLRPPGAGSTALPACALKEYPRDGEKDAKACCPDDRIVWNSKTRARVYWCEGSRFYYHTMHGVFMCEKGAKAKGLKPAHGGKC
jgi:hypothetical protein